ncbi:hypothetical protein STENM223S_01858 [Streptomyces tendae]
MINAATDTVTATVPAGGGPEAVAFDPAGSRAYVANANSPTVTVIDTATSTATVTFDVGSRPARSASVPTPTSA